MEYLFPLLLTLHILVGLSVIGLVLLQHGKGADMGAAFGSGASGSLFGATGSANFLSRATAGLATVFFLTSLGLTYLASNRPAAPSSVMQAPDVPASVPVPLPGGAEQKAGEPTAGDAIPAPGGGAAAKSDEKPAAKATEDKPAADAKPAAQEDKPASAEPKADAAPKKAEGADKPAGESKAKDIPR